jgi:FkbM family methyltransferase
MPLHFEWPVPEIAREPEVAACYRLILGRDPDPDGLRAHVAARLPLPALIRSLVMSPEYCSREEILHTISLYELEFAIRADSIYHEDYESHVFYRLMDLIGPGTTFLDVGANIGMFAVHAAKRGAQAIAVEPRASNCSLLLENARRAGVTVELHPLAASDCHGYAVLDLASDGENAAIRRHEASSRGDAIVALGLLDELIGERRIDLLKIDVEGHEYRALRGARRLLERHRPLIVTEYSPDFQRDGSGVSGETYLGFLRHHGYAISIFDEDGDERPLENFSGLDVLCQRLGHVDLICEPAAQT